MVVEKTSYNAALAQHFCELLAGADKEQAAREATQWFYELSCRQGYVKDPDGVSQLYWRHASLWGELEISINRVKPEKDPRAIAQARNAYLTDTAACDLCIQEAPNLAHTDDVQALTQQIDIQIPKNLCIEVLPIEDEIWGLQYSPYGYFSEHCIALSPRHRPMHIDRSAFQGLFNFIDVLPHYFVGSNADLPVVGGSILGHDHFQAGKHVFPMMKAESVQSFSIAGFEQVSASVVRWPVTVLRLSALNTSDLIECATRILTAWQSYDDETLGIRSHGTDSAPHHTITPILRKVEATYILDLALRSNITTNEHPLGVFHPHEDKWHVKKENIGLIEVMGLAILPARLIEELEQDTLTQESIGHIFSLVLEDVGVFKWDEAGRAGLNRFLATLA